MSTPPQSDYDVALSFAGEDRAYVSRVAAVLKNAQVKVFYDAYEKVTLWGKDLYEHLSDVYQHRARFTVLFASKHYADKVWTNHERKSAQARAIADRREYILPARFDDSEIPGLLATTGYIDLRTETPEQFAALILEKLGRERPSWESAPGDSLPGEPVPRGQSLRSLAVQLSTAAAARERRRQFLDSEAGVAEARREAESLIQRLEEEVVALKGIDPHLNIEFAVDHQRVALVRSPQASFTMHWGLEYSNTLKGASLFTQEFDRSYSLSGRHREPQRKDHWHFEVDEAGTNVWRHAAEAGIALTTKQLADRYLSRVIQRVYGSADTDWNADVDA